jgi:hypothetical protein
MILGSYQPKPSFLKKGTGAFHVAVANSFSRVLHRNKSFGSISQKELLALHWRRHAPADGDKTG